MSISYPLTLPTVTGIQNITFTTVNAVAMSMSPFTYKQQVFAHQGQRWVYSFSDWLDESR